MPSIADNDRWFETIPLFWARFRARLIVVLPREGTRDNDFFFFFPRICVITRNLVCDLLV